MLSNGQKIDLCAQKVTIDFAALLRTAQIAVFLARCDVENRLRDIQNADVVRPLTSEWLADAAKRFAEANEVYYALSEATKREELEIVRREIKQN